MFFLLFFPGDREDPDLYLWLTDPDADPGGPKTYGSYGSGFGYATQIYTIHFLSSGFFFKTLLFV